MAERTSCRILAVDLGDRRTGMAISDPGGSFALGLPLIETADGEEMLEGIVRVALDRCVEEIVIGLPKNMDGSLGPRARLTLEFAEQLHLRTGIPVTPWDERLTSVQAEDMVAPMGLGKRRRKQQVNTVAAQLILDSFLGARKRRGAEPQA